MKQIFVILLFYFACLISNLFHLREEFCNCHFVIKKDKVMYGKIYSLTLFGKDNATKTIKYLWFLRHIFVFQFFEFAQKVAKLIMLKRALFFIFDVG